jgi:hypothetical protein
MRSLPGVVQMIVRICGVVQITLGLLFWFGFARGLVDLHMLVGIVLVVGLWSMCVLAAVNRVGPALPAVGFLLGLLVVWLGLNQTSLLTGGAHWVIQVLHLLVGMSAIGFSEMLAGRIKATGARAVA